MSMTISLGPASRVWVDADEGVRSLQLGVWVSCGRLSMLPSPGRGSTWSKVSGSVTIRIRQRKGGYSGPHWKDDRGKDWRSDYGSCSFLSVIQCLAPGLRKTWEFDKRRARERFTDASGPDDLFSSQECHGLWSHGKAARIFSTDFILNDLKILEGWATSREHHRGPFIALTGCHSHNGRLLERS